jgi:cation:H+ antiporter
VDILVFGGGLVLLIGGAWVLITGGIRVAAALGLPAVVVGLTVVACGTSAPELFVSILGAASGSTGLVLGNVIGSNVANLGLILGLAAIIRPVVVERRLASTEVPFMLVVSIAFAAMTWDGTLGRMDAAILVACFVGFMVWTFRNRDRGLMVAVPDCPPVPAGHKLREVLLGSGLVALGVVGLAGGGHLIVKAAVRIAVGFGVSETLVGLTMVAVGTSLPELATTIVAAIRKEDDLAVGNIIGSNIFNILAVAGPVGLYWRLNIEGPQTPLAGVPLHPSGNQVQLLSMVVLAALTLGLVLAGRGRVGRRSGWLLLAAYVGTMVLWTT